MIPEPYPFPALVGQEDLKLTLLLNAVCPEIGGVLIEGDRGTAKSTAVRGLQEVLPSIPVVSGCPYRCDPRMPWPECPSCSDRSHPDVQEIPVPFVSLPLGATEDRVLGTLDVARSLQQRERVFQPGLLAQAHRGILYIDEVNLLPDHLVDVLLDVAASGVNVVHREGLSMVHPARFLLIGTMNPEEGNLRPQFLDRFGLRVVVQTPQEPAVREEIIRRRLAFEADPTGFRQQWVSEIHRLQSQVQKAWQRLPKVELGEEVLKQAVTLSLEAGVEGHRADLILCRVARALAAWEGRSRVTPEDLKRCAHWVLDHRRRSQTTSRPPSREGIEPPPSTSTPSQSAPVVQGKPSNASSDARSGTGTGIPPEQHGEGNPIPWQGRLQVVNPRSLQTRWREGRRNPGGQGTRGQWLRSIPTLQPVDLDVGATLQAALIRSAGAIDTIEPSDWRQRVRMGQTGTCFLFLVDASGSMAARRRMEAVKGAVLGLLQDAYTRRDWVGVIAFRGLEAQVLLSPTRKVEQAREALKTLPTGGRTPLAHGLALAWKLAQQETQRQEGTLPFLVLLTDGRANVPLKDTPGDPWKQALEWAHRWQTLGWPAMVVDLDPGGIQRFRIQALQEALGGICVSLETFSAQGLLRVLQQLSCP